MGTNYYLTITEGETCFHCGRSDKSKTLHIGKSSFGWCFSLHVSQEEGINNLDDWIGLFQSGVITNEYGQEIPVEEMISTIKDRSREMVNWENSAWYGYKGEADFHAKNHSQRGPNNLLRHSMDGTHWVGHGEGTWDYISGEFS